MSTPSPAKTKTLLIAGAAGLVIALWFGWQWAGKEPEAPAPVTKTKDKAGTKTEPNLLSTPQPTTPPAEKKTEPGQQLMTAEEGDVLIDEILRSDKEIPQMARDLHELVKKLNGEAQVNASHHLVNLTSDEDYGLIAGLLVDQKTNPEVLDVLFSDLMNRNRELQMPLFMNILKNPQHPQSQEVRDVLTILAGEDFGNDWAAWDKWAIEELQANQ
ncbi:MAG TPA: hypothetical protein DIT64_21800 [Verrucomicrobiales bacterium]|mgnify:CR=1 FL=1|nr:hypothetical protein [Verrucomicrobiales bacterium]HCN79157.1 hypothetical protein [Verrucomicrobiales bacterium]HRJ06977.1 hypothetical protein [Prosthecobacter sp.]HRK13085.1 hypothetical protein [Prosthecobacter sp.]